MLSKIIMPKLGETMEEGKLVKWLKKEGDQVDKGEPLFEVMTDKANFEQESLAGGFLRKIIGREGETIKVTQVIGYLADSMDEPLSAEKSEDKKGEEKKVTEHPSSPEIEDPKSEKPVQEEGKIKISPLAKKLAETQNIDVSKIKGSGPGGRITKEDVEAVIAKKEKQEIETEPAQTVLSGEKEVISLTGLRKIVAERLTQSKKEIPHYYLHLEVDMSESIKLRNELIEQFEKTKGIRISYNDLVVKAVATALEEFPLLNSTFESGKINKFKEININIAVSLEDGLTVPVIRKVNQKDLLEIGQESQDLARKARENHLSLQELSDGTFTVSNLGMFGIDSFEAIINPPQVGILAVGRMKDCPLVREGKIEVRPLMKLSMSCDHRVVDGSLGAQFLTRIKQILEKPYPPLWDRRKYRRG